jgi:hemolysin III
MMAETTVQEEHRGTGTPRLRASPGQVRPVLRGRLHEAAFWMSAAAGPALVIAAPGDHRLSVAVYAVTLSLLLGTSALYHRITWRPRARAFMRRLDHAMIFLLIAGTYTAAAGLALEPARAAGVLTAVWIGAVAGVVLAVAWPSAPKPLSAAVAIALGWVALAVLPDLARGLTTSAFVLLVVGGVSYSVGAIVYASRWPNPVPGVAGYHEVFHALVVLAAAAHYAMVALALP